MRVEVKTNILELQKTLDGIASEQLPYASAQTLNHLASLVRGGEKTVMQKVFDRPTDWTLNSMAIDYAKKQDWPKQHAETYFKRYSTKGTTPDDYLMAEVTGGVRKRKRMENALIKRGIMESNEYAIPAKGADLDPFGNMKRGQVMKILADLQASETFSGHTSNRSKSKRSQAKVKNSSYFFADLEGTRGIWQRMRIGGATGVRPILVFVSHTPKYRKRFAFFEIAENIVKANYDRVFAGEFKAAIATARMPAVPS